jgi:hypothetical protein
MTEHVPKSGFQGLNSLVTNVDAALRTVPSHTPSGPAKAETNVGTFPKNAEESTPTPATPSDTMSASVNKPKYSGAYLSVFAVFAILATIAIALNSEPGNSNGLGTPGAPRSTVSQSGSGDATTTVSTELSARQSDATRRVRNSSPINQLLKFISRNPPAPARRGKATCGIRIGALPQIRYCLPEDIRMRAMQNLVNQYEQASINAFNSYVDDFNSRCSHFRYHAGALARIQAEVETQRSALNQQGELRAMNYQ